MIDRKRFLWLPWLFALAVLLPLGTSPALAFHFPWDQGHDTFNPDQGDDDTDPGDDDPCKTGSPFQVATGNFIFGSQDLYVQTPGIDFDISRTYNSHDLRDGLFGFGWTFSFDQRVVHTSDGSMTFAISCAGSGKRERWTLGSTGSYTAPAYSSSRLVGQSDGSLRLTDKEGIVRAYDAEGRLVSIADRNGNTLTLSYDATGFMTTIADGAGRTVRLNKGANGRIASIVDPAGRIFNYVYDSNGNLIRALDPAGGATVYTYDANHNLLTVTEPGGGVVQRVTYDTEGRVKTYLERGGTWTVTYLPDQSRTIKRDPRGNNWTLIYNSKGAVVQSIDPLGKSESRTFDDRSNVSSITDKNGNTTLLQYDAGNNLVAVTDPFGKVARFTWDATLNLPTSITDPAGAATNLVYDGRGNLTRFTDTTGRVQQSTYDSRGLRTSFTDSTGKTSTFSYDQYGYLTQVRDSAGRTQTFSYDILGRLTSIRDPEGGTSTYDYDTNGHLARVVDSLGHETTYTYDAAGNMLTLRDVNGGTYLFEYDAFRRLKKVTNAQGQSRTFTYDVKGNLISTVDAKGQLTQAVYDAADRLTQKTTVDDVVNYTYDSAGNVVSIRNNNSNLTFTYNAMGQLTAAATGATAHQPATSIGYTYDTRGNRITMVDPQGGVTSYVYDLLGRMTRITDPQQQSTVYSYDVDSRVSRVDLPNGVSSLLTYDVGGRLTSLVHQRGNAELARFDYTYDGRGQRLTMTEAAGLHTFSYDALGRLTGATHPQVQNPDEFFSYDPIGNRLSSHLSASYSYSVTNRLLTDADFDYDYDANGNMIRKTRRATGEQTTFTYNAGNQLVGITLPNGTAISYFYDGLGRRIEKNVNGAVTRYLYDGERMLWELDGSNAVVARYTHGSGLDEPLAMQRGGNWYFYLTDGLGSVRGLADASGAVVQTYAYDSFGRVVEQTGNVPNPFLFTSREFDAESGLYFYRARYLDPQIGRFLQEDPLHITSSDLNLYGYVGNDPINLTDPMGLDWLENLSNFAAGFGDSLTFGLTDWIREQMGINDVVDKCSGWYKGGEYTEIAAEIAATAGSALLKNLAKNAVRAEVRREAARMTADIAREGRQLHHINPLFGHPGGAPTLFPTGGLPAWIHSGRWNTELLTKAEHLAAHRRLREMEELARTAVNPAMTGGRAAANALRDCGCN